MAIAPVILSLHPELDARQREVVGHVDGPLPGIAGPGAGKTQSIQLRAINLLLTGKAAAGELLLYTFGSDAARGQQQRFQKSALACGIRGALSEVRIGTIHSLCHRLLAPHVGLAGLRLDYRVLDEHEQHMLLHQEFDAIFGPDWDIPSGRGWRDGVHTVAEAGRYFDRICDEMIYITKRPGLAVAFWERHKDELKTWHPNIWLGTSVENQKYAPRLTVLARVPAAVRFVSAEPLIDEINLTKWLEAEQVDWIIVGGESGPDARPMGTEWARDLKDQAHDDNNRASFFLKQLGGASDKRGGDKAVLDGEIYHEMPATRAR